MASFAYRVKAPNGNILTGAIEAGDLKVAIDRLKTQKYVVLEIAESGRGFLSTLSSFNPFKPKVKPKDLVLFCRQLSTLVSAGVPIVQGLSILEAQVENPAFRSVVSGVKEDIEAGFSISDAMNKHPHAFGELFCGMIRAGEVGGILDVILERLSGYLESAAALRGKVKGAMMYPAVVFSIAGAVTIFLLTVVIPTFKTIFEGFGAELPLPTQVLITLSDFLRKNILFIIASPIVFFFAFKRYYKTPAGQLQMDTLFLKMPIFGDLLRRVAIAKFTRTMGTLVKSGVPILQALDTVAKTSGNKVIERAILRARESIREGEHISDPLKRSGVFPPMVIQMISVGEETGNLDTMLSKIADFYDQEVDNSVKGLTSMIEPLIIVFMGLVIGSIVIAMFLPMMELGNLASKAG